MKVLVIGDSCTDIFRYGKCDRLSPEAPVPIFNPIKEIINGGMSINVKNNIEALGVECDIVTNDYRPVKTRLVDAVSNQIIVRVDENEGVIDELPSDMLDEIKFHEYDAVIISDYNKGFLSNSAIEVISQRHPLTFLDTKKKLANWSENIEFIKINDKEFRENFLWLRNNYKHQLIVTMGNEGAMHNMTRKFSIEDEHPVRDLSGAGDTFLAGLVVKFLENNNIDEAIRFANNCASWVVTQKGVVAVNPNQL